MMIATVMPAATNAAGYPSARIASGRPTTAHIEGRDPKRRVATRAIHVTAAGIRAHGVRRRKAPSAVATPFPPQNPRNTGQQFPTTASTAAAPLHAGPAPARLPIHVAR